MSKEVHEDHTVHCTFFYAKNETLSFRQSVLLNLNIVSSRLVTCDHDNSSRSPGFFEVVQNYSRTVSKNVSVKEVPKLFYSVGSRLRFGHIQAESIVTLIMPLFRTKLKIDIQLVLQ